VNNPDTEQSQGDAMTTKVAHDLKNLLARVLANLELLHRQPLDERGRRQLERAEQGAWQAEELIRNCPRLPTTALADKGVLNRPA